MALAMGNCRRRVAKSLSGNASAQTIVFVSSLPALEMNGGFKNAQHLQTICTGFDSYFHQWSRRGPTAAHVESGFDRAVDQHARASTGAADGHREI